MIKAKHLMQALIMTAILFFGHECLADSFDTYMERCEDYRETVERILVEEGVPVEYFALLLAESGCDLDNVSHKGAKGAWQLTDATARTYGVENPYDIEQSTRGAARYLKSLIGRFHDMKWVIAAYNAGGTNLKRVTGYPNADFAIVKQVRPEAYYLSLKVRNFVGRIKAYDLEQMQNDIEPERIRQLQNHDKDSKTSGTGQSGRPS